MRKQQAKAYSYIRFSTAKQAGGDSLRRQTERSTEWAEANGYTLDDSLRLRDLGMSAYSGDNVVRGKLGAFLQAVDSGDVAKGSVLIVESLDRLTRKQVPDALELFLAIVNRGIIIVTLTPEETFDRRTLDMTQLIIVIVILSRAFEESATKSDRVGKAWARKRVKLAEEGVKLSGKCPFWLRLDRSTNTFRLDQRKAAIVREVFRRCADGSGFNRLLQFLNDGTLPAARGKTWQRSSLGRLLRSKAVLGEFKPKDMEIIPDYYPQIITPEEYYAAQSAMDNRRHQPGRKGKHETNLFTGLIRDGRDGSTVTLTVKGTRQTGPQIVSSAASRGVAGSRYLAFCYQTFERVFLQEISGLTPADLYPPTDKRDGKAVELRKLTSKISVIDGQLAEMAEAEVEVGKTKTMAIRAARLEADRDRLAVEVEELRATMATQSATSLASSQELITLLQSTTDKEALLDLRTRIKSKLASLVDSITVWIDGSRNDRSIFVCVLWRDGGMRNLSIRKRITYAGKERKSTHHVTYEVGQKCTFRKDDVPLLHDLLSTGVIHP